MKTAFKNIFAGTGILIVYMALGYMHSGEFQGPLYVVNFIIRMSLIDGNIFAIIFWLGCYVVAIACIILGCINAIKVFANTLRNKRSA